MKTSFVITYMVVAVLASAAAQVTYTWNPSPTTNVTGYKLYYGVASRTYTNVVDVGAATNATVTQVEGVLYYAAATAYNGVGIESDFSNETSGRTPLPPTAFAVTGGMVSWIRLAWTPTTTPGATYLVRYGIGTNSTDFATTTNNVAISNLTAGATYTFRLTAVDTTGLKSRWLTNTASIPLPVQNLQLQLTP